jgi:Tfp pilus assembly protein PilX
MHHDARLTSERGSAILIAVFVLFILTLLGLYATTSSTVDIQIASNDRDYVGVFYTAESGWQVAVSWIDAQYPLPTINMGLDTSGGSDSFSAGKYASPDSTALDPKAINSYSVTSQYNGTQKAAGYSTDFKRFLYTITSTGNGSQNAESQVVVAAHKVGKVGTY